MEGRQLNEVRPGLLEDPAAAAAAAAIAGGGAGAAAAAAAAAAAQDAPAREHRSRYTFSCVHV